MTRDHGSLAPINRSLPVFLAAGAVGFAVDAGTMMALVHWAAWTPLAARVVSFPAALTCTWWLNRRLAYAGRGPGSLAGEYAGYAMIQVLGAAINLGVFVACLALWPALIRVPVVPLAVGAVVALAFNFFAVRNVLYRQRRGQA